MINTVIEFGGFYGSIHESIIENTIESYLTLDNGELCESYDSVNWRANFENYVKFYAYAFEQWLNFEYLYGNDVQIKFDNVTLSSPKYYNFKTDTIETAISESAEKVLIDIFKTDKEFLTYLYEATQSVSGYISFYSYREVLRDNKDNIFTHYLFRYLADKFNESELSQLSDFQNIVLPELQGA